MPGREIDLEYVELVADLNDRCDALGLKFRDVMSGLIRAWLHAHPVVAKKESMKAGSKFYYVTTDNRSGEPVLVTCTITRITPARVSFTAEPRFGYKQELGNLDAKRNRYVEPKDYHLKDTTPYKAAERFWNNQADNVESAERRLDQAIKLRDAAARLALKYTPTRVEIIAVCRPAEDGTAGPQGPLVPGQDEKP